MTTPMITEPDNTHGIHFCNRSSGLHVLSSKQVALPGSYQSLHNIHEHSCSIQHAIKKLRSRKHGTAIVKSTTTSLNQVPREGPDGELTTRTSRKGPFHPVLCFSFGFPVLFSFHFPAQHTYLQGCASSSLQPSTALAVPFNSLSRKTVGKGNDQVHIHISNLQRAGMLHVVTHSFDLDTFCLCPKRKRFNN